MNSTRNQFSQTHSLFWILLFSIFIFSRSSDAQDAGVGRRVIAHAVRWFPGHNARPDRPLDMWGVDDWNSSFISSVKHAAAHGVDGFAIDIVNDPIMNMQQLVGLAADSAREAPGFSIAPCMDLASEAMSYNDWIDFVRAWTVQTAGKPGIQRVGNRPVIWTYYGYRWPASSSDPNRPSWDAFRSRVVSSVGTNPFLVGEMWGLVMLKSSPERQRLLAPYARSLDGVYFFSNNTEGQFDDLVNAVQDSENSDRKERVVAVTVKPGYWRVGQDGFNKKYEGTLGFENTWKEAVQKRGMAEWVNISTWNDYEENTHIQSSRNFSDVYLQLTQKYSAAFKRLSAPSQEVCAWLTAPAELGGIAKPIAPSQYFFDVEGIYEVRAQGLKTGETAIGSFSIVDKTGSVILQSAFNLTPVSPTAQWNWVPTDAWLAGRNHSYAWAQVEMTLPNGKMVKNRLPLPIWTRTSHVTYKAPRRVKLIPTSSSLEAPAVGMVNGFVTVSPMPLVNSERRIDILSDLRIALNPGDPAPAKSFLEAALITRDGDVKWAAPLWNSASSTVAPKQNQTITFPLIPARRYDQGPYTLTAAASSGLPVSYSSSNPAVANVNGSVIRFVGVGSTVITASQSGNDRYNPANPVSRTLNISKGNQKITFTALPVKTFGDPTFPLTASASSGLPIRYSSDTPAVARVQDSRVTIVGAGRSLITAIQQGNALYNPASTVVRTFTVAKTGQTIRFNAIPPKVIGDAPFRLVAAATSGLPITYTSSNSSVATVNDSTVTIVRRGTAVITARQLGNGNFLRAPNVSQTLTVNSSSASASIVTLSVMEGRTSEKFHAKATWRASRTGSVSAPLTVNYSLSGTATMNVDYHLSDGTMAGHVTIPVGSNFAEIHVRADSDTVNDPEETIIATLAQGTGYGLGSEMSGVARIGEDLNVPSVVLEIPSQPWKAPADIDLNAIPTAVDSSTVVAAIEFYNGSTLIGRVTQVPYRIRWSGVSVGSYSITAKVVDWRGVSGFSPIVPVTVSRPKALFIDNIQTEAAPWDEFAKTRLEILGFEVTVMDDAVVTDLDAAAHDVILISDTVFSTMLNTRFRNLAKPIVVWEPLLLDDLGMTGENVGVDYGRTHPQNSVLFSESDPFRTGLTGNRVLFTTSVPMVAGIPSSGAMLTAADALGRSVCFAYEKNAVMVSGSAPARRVCLPFFSRGSMVNEEGLKLFDAVVIWAAQNN